jgi:hypothetical protein
MNLCLECRRQEMHAEFLCVISLKTSTWNTEKKVRE